MGMLDFLSAAITPANQAVNAFQQGRQDRQKVQEAESLRMLDQLRKAQEAQEQGDVRKATLRNIDSQIKVREAPRTPPVARTQYDAKRRQVVNLDTNEASDVAGLAPDVPEAAPEMSPYQREQLKIQQARLRLEQGRATSSGGSPSAKPPKAPTEAQEKSHIFHSLMANSAPELDALAADPEVSADRITLALRSGPFDFVTNRALNDKEQKLLRAARDFTAGVLRKESGAAIKNDEILNTFQRMIPLSGEGDALKQAKQAARAQYMRTMEESALPASLYYGAVRNNGVVRTTQAEEAAGETGEFAGGKPSLQARVGQLRAEGKTKEQAKAILAREGYKVP